MSWAVLSRRIRLQPAGGVMVVAPAPRTMTWASRTSPPCTPAGVPSCKLVPPPPLVAVVAPRFTIDPDPAGPAVLVGVGGMAVFVATTAVGGTGVEVAGFGVAVGVPGVAVAVAGLGVPVGVTGVGVLVGVTGVGVLV